MKKIISAITLAIASFAAQAAPGAQVAPAVLNGDFAAGYTDWSVSPTVQGDMIQGVSNSSNTSNIGPWWSANPGVNLNGATTFYWQDGSPTYRGIISQTISGLTVGTSYNVSFQQAATSYQFLNYPNNPSNPTNTLDWQVGLGGSITPTSQGYALLGASVLNSAVMTVNNGTPNIGWEKQSLTFKATSQNELLSFLAIGTGNPPVAFLDGISIAKVTSPVPEPVNVLMMGAGLLVIILIQKRRKILV